MVLGGQLMLPSRHVPAGVKDKITAVPFGEKPVSFGHVPKLLHQVFSQGQLLGSPALLGVGGKG